MTETIETDLVTAAESLLPPVQEAREVAVREEAPATLATIPDGPGALLAATLQLARDPNFDPAKLQVMLDMQYRLEDRQAERAFAVALAEAESEIPQVSRLGIVDLNKKGEPYDPKKKYNFSRLEDIDTILRPIMTRHGFAIYFDRQQRETQGGGLVVTGTLTHKDGASRTASFPVPLDTGPGRNNLQAAGSSDSYARRYILEGFFHIVRKAKDDDGATADPLTTDEIEDLMELLSRTKTSIVGFLKTMISAIDWGGDPDDPDYRPDPVILLEQVQRMDFPRMHKVLAAKLHAMNKKAGVKDDQE